MQGREPTFGDGRYIIRRELGRGTMGVVYEAEDAVLARTVAVKTIELAFAAGEEARSEFEQRFFTEARVAARLSHPGIVVCHDVGKDAASGKLFIVFEYLKGRTLADRAAEGPMDWRDALEVVVQVARAIHHAHEHGVVHRDLKPANIMLLDRGASGASAARAEAAVKIMDFGVARLESLGQRLTRTGQSFGSPLYMSPEQALGQPSSARSDIFSLGSVLCTLLLGRPWFEAPSLPEIVRRVVHDDPPRLSSLRPDVPASLDAVVAMALAKREDDRYATAADMADDLEDVLAGRAARQPAGRDGLLAGLTAAAAGPRGADGRTTRWPRCSTRRRCPRPAAGPLPLPPLAAQTTPMASRDRRHDRARAAAGWCRPARCSCWRCSPPARSSHGAAPRAPEPTPPPSGSRRVARGARRWSRRRSPRRPMPTTLPPAEPTVTTPARDRRLRRQPHPRSRSSDRRRPSARPPSVPVDRAAGGGRARRGRGARRATRRRAASG